VSHVTLARGGDFRVALEETEVPPSSLYVNLAAAYWRLGNSDKSIHTLKRAVAIEPINENAVVFLADALHILRRSEEAIPYLEHLTEYERASERVWSRAARACLDAARTKRNDVVLLDKARIAMRHHLALHDHAELWNDLGVVEFFAGNKDAALRYFSQSLKKLDDLRKDYGLPLSNVLVLAIEDKRYDNAYAVSKKYLEEHSPDASKAYAKIILQHAVCLEARGEWEEGIRVLEDALRKDVGNLEACVEMLNQIVCYYAFVSPQAEENVEYVRQLRTLIEDSDGDLPDIVVARSTNNIAFAYLKAGNAADAEALLPRLSQAIGKDPYSTATLGLYHLIKHGDVKRTEELYTRAVSIAHDKTLKNRIRQTMHFEIARFLDHTGNRAEATRRYEKVLKLANGFDFLNSQANKQLARFKAMPRRLDPPQKK